MLIVIAIFEHQIVDCYDQDSTVEMDLSRENIILHLSPTLNQECVFPNGILGILQFADQSLDIAQIFTNFNYFTTKELLFKCTDCINYDQIQDISAIIDSIGIYSDFSVGVIQNVRYNSEICDVAHILVSPTAQIITSDIDCFQISGTNIFSSSVFKMIHSNVVLTEFYTGVITTNATTLIITFDEVSIYELLQTQMFDMQLIVQGSTDDLFFSFNIVVNSVKFENQKEIITNTLVFQQSSQVSYQGVKNQSEIFELGKFFLANQIDQFHFILTIQTDLQLIASDGYFSIIFFEKFMTLPCQITSNVTQCLILTDSLFHLDLSKVLGQVNLQYLSKGKIISSSTFPVTSFVIGCFKYAEVDVSFSQLSIKLIKANNSCWLSNTNDVQIYLTGFKTYIDLAISQNVLVFQQFTSRNWNDSILYLAEDINASVLQSINDPQNKSVEHFVIITREGRSETVIINKLTLAVKQDVMISIVIMCVTIILAILAAIGIMLFEQVLKSKIKQTKKVTKSIKLIDDDDIQK